jgi:hypothetical protein
MAREGGAPRSTYWNVWWTLTVITAAATLVVLALEALGVFSDLGLVLSLAGILLSIVFGMSASTRSAVGTVRGALGALRGDTGAVRDEVGALRGDVGAVRDEVGALRGDVGAVRDGLGAVQNEVAALRLPLERILATLIERLPPAPSH